MQDLKLLCLDFFNLCFQLVCLFDFLIQYLVFFVVLLALAVKAFFLLKNTLFLTLQVCTAFLQFTVCLVLDAKRFLFCFKQEFLFLCLALLFCFLADAARFDFG